MSLLRIARHRLCAPASRICTGASPMSIASQMQTRSLAFIRHNSTSSQAVADAQDISLAAQVYPINQDVVTEDDVDAWLDAVHELKTGKLTAETEKELYLQQLTNPEPFLEEEKKFVPTAQQLEQVASFETVQIPLQNDPLVDNLTNLIMRHGRKSVARKTVSRALYIIYLKTRKDPLEILYETVDKLAPLMATVTQKTGTAKNKVVPYPLNTRQRNRYAILWILDGSNKKKSSSFSVRLAEEILSAYEGKSSGYDKKAQMHKVAISQRAYIQV